MRLRDKIKIVNIPIDRIKTDQTPEDRSLQNSLFSVSQKYPVKVRPIEHPDFDYQIVNGRQRINALLAMGETQVLALVEAMDDTELHLQALIGNANKPNELDEGYHIIYLEQVGYTDKEIAKICRFSSSTVTQRKKLVQKLHKLGQQKLQSGEIKVSTALEATKLPLSEQVEIFGNGHNPTYKEVFEKVRSWESAQLAFDIEPETDVKPGLFLTAEQVEQLLGGHSIEVSWIDNIFNIKKTEHEQT